MADDPNAPSDPAASPNAPDGILNALKAIISGHPASTFDWANPTAVGNALQDAAKPVPGWGYGFVLPVAYRGGDSDTNPGGPLQMRFALPSMAKAVMGGLGDLINGPATGQVTPAATNALMTLGLGSGAALGPEESVAGMFAGMKAKGAPLGQLQAAQKLLDAGISPQDVFHQTGMTSGPGNLARYEIDDSGAKLNSLGDGRIVPLSSVLDHPELYKAYPNLADMKVTAKNLGNTYGQFTSYLGNPSLSRIDINPYTPGIRGTLLHEVQHAIQAQEGPFTGTTGLDQNVYGRQQSEVEARNTDLRKDMSPAMRAKTDPTLTEDVTRDGQLNGMSPIQRGGASGNSYWPIERPFLTPMNQMPSLDIPSPASPASGVAYDAHDDLLNELRAFQRGQLTK